MGKDRMGWMDDGMEETKNGKHQVESDGVEWVTYFVMFYSTLLSSSSAHTHTSFETETNSSTLIEMEIPDNHFTTRGCW